MGCRSDIMVCTMETYRQKRCRFTVMLARLIDYANSLGFELAIDRTRDNSSKRLHKYVLAADFNLYKNGHYLRSTSSHKPLGLYWEAMGGTWGGRFGDGNHYSLPYNGIK